MRVDSWLFGLFSWLWYRFQGSGFRVSGFGLTLHRFGFRADPTPRQDKKHPPDARIASKLFLQTAAERKRARARWSSPPSAAERKRHNFNAFRLKMAEFGPDSRVCSFFARQRER